MPDTKTRKGGPATSEADDEAMNMEVATAPEADLPDEDAADVEAEQAMNAAHPEEEEEMLTEEKETPRSRGRAGIQIIETNGKFEAIVPRNSYIFLNTIAKHKALTLDEQKTLLTDDQFARVKNTSKVYQIGPGVPVDAFPGKESAKTLVQTVKKSLADQGTPKKPKKPVIQILKAGDPGSPAIIELLVDTWTQKEGNQGVSTTTTGATRGRPKSKKTSTAKRTTTSKRKTNVGAATSAKSGRKPGRPKNSAVSTTRIGRKFSKGNREAFMNSLPLPSYGAYKLADEGMDMLESKYPELYSAILKLAA